MEFMDKGSFEGIYKTIGGKVEGEKDPRAGPIPIGIVRQVAKRVLGGLVYLYEEMGVLHRDIKPSNILLNSEGAFPYP
jgi:mitogen-activated protein kinase kinase